MFFCEICEFFKNIFYRTPLVAALTPNQANVFMGIVEVKYVYSFIHSFIHS